MNKISYLLIFIACFWILPVDCQGGGGGEEDGRVPGRNISDAGQIVDEPKDKEIKGGGNGGGGDGGRDTGRNISDGGRKDEGNIVDVPKNKGRKGDGHGQKGNSTSGSSCTSEECRQEERTVLSVLLAVIVVGILMCLLCKCCKGNTSFKVNTPSNDNPSSKGNQSSKGNPSKNNATFVRPNPPDNPEECRQQENPILFTSGDNPNIFRNGVWSSRYCQYGKWSSPSEFILSFDPEPMQVKGWGWDNIGKFTIIGNYSNETVRMGITKTYIKGTGDSKENLGHSVTIQLTRNTRTAIFEGKFYVQTSRYQGEGKFELKYVGDFGYYESV